MSRLKGFQRTYLRGLAHRLKVVVQIGLKGLSEGTLAEIDDALDRHELIKIKFNEVKEKEQKLALSAEIETHTESEMVGMIGHTCILYRRHADPEKRSIRVPVRDTSQRS